MLKPVTYPDGKQRSVHLGAWKRQSSDIRDALFAVRYQTGLTARPASYDLRSICSEVEDQGNLGSCTANMLAGMVEANEIRGGAKLSQSSASVGASVAISNVVVATDGTVTFTTTVTPAASPAPAPAPDPTPAPTPDPTPAPAPAPKLVQISRLFEYYATRQIEGSVSYDSGATIRDTVKAAAKYGLVDEASWPYDISKFATRPPSTLWSSALTHKVTSYHSISNGDIETMKVTISTGYLVGFGFDVYSAFMGQNMANTGLLCRPKTGETLQGGHAVALVGYDDTKVMPDGSKGAFLVRNSWGKDWGLNGYFWMAYNYVADISLCSDFWVVVNGY